jgi:tripartite ATP-independent transporter DctP family solute receptor
MFSYVNIKNGKRMFKLKKLSLFLMFMVVVMMLAACGGNSSSSNDKEGTNGDKDGKKIVWKFGFINKKDHPWGKTAQKFADAVKKKTDDQITVKLYPNSQLGSETDTLNEIKAGTADLTISGETMENWAPKAALMAVPYAITSNEQMKKVIEGDIGKEIEQQIKDKVGVTPLYYHMRAPRNLTSNKPIHSPKDLSGFKMRVPDVPLFLDAWKAAGAKPQAMAFDEVFTALQQGVIDGQENPYDLIYDNGLYEVQKYINQTQHVRSWIYVVIGNKQFNSLSPDLQKKVKEAAKEAQEYGNKLFKKSNEEYRKKLLDEGMKINKDVDQKAFKKAMMPGIKKDLTDEQYKLFKKMQGVK